jgi:hypothetical protein
MTIAATCYEHIAIDEHGVPYIAGTTMKVGKNQGDALLFSSFQSLNHKYLQVRGSAPIGMSPPFYLHTIKKLLSSQFLPRAEQ